MVKIHFVQNARWWTASILKMRQLQYLRRIVPDFEEIWYVDVTGVPGDHFVIKTETGSRNERSAAAYCRACSKNVP